MTPNFEQVLSQARALPPEQQKRLIEALSQAEPPPAMTEEEFQAHLLREGIISELPKSLSEREEKRDFTPITVTGAPLSETIIEERR